MQNELIEKIKALRDPFENIITAFGLLSREIQVAEARLSECINVMKDIDPDAPEATDADDVFEGADDEAR